jgi:hypothetical protein
MLMATAVFSTCALQNRALIIVLKLKQKAKQTLRINTISQ